MNSKRKTQKVVEDPDALRLKRVDEIMNSAFQLNATGTVFEIGVEPESVSWEDIVYVLNRLYTTGYVVEYKLLPYNLEPEVLVSSLSKETVAWLVPILIQAVDRKALAGQIDILAPNNESLVYLMDVCSWYWYKVLHGPKPATRSMLKLSQKPAHMVVQNAALCCPLCYHQYNPPETYKTQEAKAWGYVRWLPTHMVDYHLFTPPSVIKTWVNKTSLANLKENQKARSKLINGGTK